MRHIVLLLALASTGAAPAADLEVGSMAPPLSIEKWITGEPIVLSEGKDKHIYVIEFWATWCGPCIQTIPHLSKTAKHFEKHGVKVIGVSVDGERTRAKVEPFVKEMGKKMDYAVALDRLPSEGDRLPSQGKGDDPTKLLDPKPSEGGDDPTKPAGEKKPASTQEAYLEAAKVEGIPHAFIVGKDGKVAWHGHPMTGLDVKLAEMVGDKDYLDRAKKIEQIREKIEVAFKDDKFDDTISGLEELHKVEGDDGVLIPRYLLILTKKKDAEAAAKAGEHILKTVNDSELLDRFAWVILTGEEYEGVRDTKLALSVAQKANELTEGKNWSVVDTYAKASFETGDKKKAIELQKKAVTLGEAAKVSEDDLSALMDSLKRYEGGGEEPEKKE